MQEKTHLVHLNNYMAEKKEDDKTPSKAKKPKKTTSENKEPVSQEKAQPQPPNILDPIIAKVIKDALMIHIINENKQTEINEMEAMIATCQEFMSSFIILGYDLNRQPISPIVFAHNQQEADALGAYMSKFINHNIKEIDPSAEQ